LIWRGATEEPKPIMPTDEQHSWIATTFGVDPRTYVTGATSTVVATIEDAANTVAESVLPLAAPPADVTPATPPPDDGRFHSVSTTTEDYVPGADDTPPSIPQQQPTVQPPSVGPTSQPPVQVQPPPVNPQPQQPQQPTPGSPTRLPDGLLQRADGNVDWNPAPPGTWGASLPGAPASWIRDQLTFYGLAPTDPPDASADACVFNGDATTRSAVVSALDNQATLSGYKLNANAAQSVMDDFLTAEQPPLDPQEVSPAPVYKTAIKDFISGLDIVNLSQALLATHYDIKEAIALTAKIDIVGGRLGISPYKPGLATPILQQRASNISREDLSILKSRKNELDLATHEIALLRIMVEKDAMSLDNLKKLKDIENIGPKKVAEATDDAEKSYDFIIQWCKFTVDLCTLDAKTAGWQVFGAILELAGTDVLKDKFAKEVDALKDRVNENEGVLKNAIDTLKDFAQAESDAIIQDLKNIYEQLNEDIESWLNIRGDYCDALQQISEKTNVDRSGDDYQNICLMLETINAAADACITARSGIEKHKILKNERWAKILVPIGSKIFDGEADKELKLDTTTMAVYQKGGDQFAISTDYLKSGEIEKAAFNLSRLSDFHDSESNAKDLATQWNRVFNHAFGL
jgi:hypothetical protein